METRTQKDNGSCTYSYKTENWTCDHFPEGKNKQANKTKTVIKDSLSPVIIMSANVVLDDFMIP